MPLGHRLGRRRVPAPLILALDARREFGEETDLGLDELPPIAEVQALVLTVDPARRIGGAEQERRYATERVGEGTDERDRTTDAHHDRLGAERRAQRALRRVERPALRRALPRVRRLDDLGDLALEAPRHVRLD